ERAYPLPGGLKANPAGHLLMLAAGRNVGCPQNLGWRLDPSQGSTGGGPQLRRCFMATAGFFPPDETSRRANASIPTRFTPGVVAAIDGPERLGPELAGALTLLHVTFADDRNAQRGYREFVAIKLHFCSLPGFIRWLTFSDGVDTYTLGLWRSV